MNKNAIIGIVITVIIYIGIGVFAIYKDHNIKNYARVHVEYSNGDCDTLKIFFAGDYPKFRLTDESSCLYDGRRGNSREPAACYVRNFKLLKIKPIENEEK